MLTELLALYDADERYSATYVNTRREELADVSGVALTRYPPGLISADASGTGPDHEVSVQTNSP